MRRRELLRRVRELADARGEEVRLVEGANHSKVMVGRQLIVVPRHREINELLARQILRDLARQLGGSDDGT